MTADRHQNHERKDLATQRHNEIIEQLQRINLGLEVLNRSTEQVSRQLADLVSRTETALQYVVRAWQGTQPTKPHS
jgi:hypothetical protein